MKVDESFMTRCVCIHRQKALKLYQVLCLCIFAFMKVNESFTTRCAGLHRQRALKLYEALCLCARTQSFAVMLAYRDALCLCTQTECCEGLSSSVSVYTFAFMKVNERFTTRCVCLHRQRALKLYEALCLCTQTQSFAFLC